MADQLIDLGAISVSQARKDDLLPVLSLFDEAVVWLNQRGIEKQWGTEPFSTSPQIQEQFMGWINRETMFVARLGDRIVGSRHSTLQFTRISPTAGKAFPHQPSTLRHLSRRAHSLARTSDAPCYAGPSTIHGSLAERRSGSTAGARTLPWCTTTSRWASFLAANSWSKNGAASSSRNRLLKYKAKSCSQ
jgi:hypothetical protein